MQLLKAFPSEGKVANAMSRMRCSRRRGVTFYLAMITAASQPAPHHRLRRSLSSRRSLLMQSLKAFPSEGKVGGFSRSDEV